MWGAAGRVGRGFALAGVCQWGYRGVTPGLQRGIRPADCLLGFGCPGTDHHSGSRNAAGDRGAPSCN